MRIDRCFGAIILALTLQGCAAAGLTLASAGASAGLGAGVEHTFNGIVYKTFAIPLNEVRFATLKTLDRMAMPVTADAKSEGGWQLSATASDRTIDIELQQLTARTTRMRVVANEGLIFFKDSATATEIILQTAQALDDDAAAKAANDRNRRRKAS